MLTTAPTAREILDGIEPEWVLYGARRFAGWQGTANDVRYAATALADHFGGDPAALRREGWTIPTSASHLRSLILHAAS